MTGKPKQKAIRQTQHVVLSSGSGHSGTGGSVGEHRAVMWEVVSSTPTGPTLRVLK